VSNNGTSREGQVSSLPFALSPVSKARWLAALFLLTLSLALGTQVALAQAPVDSYDEEEAQAIDQMLMCPVCPAESIDQAQVPLAKQMRQKVRDLLAEGSSRQEVLDYFADRYGQDVLASPPKSGVNLLAWALPIAGLLAALVAVFLVLRAMKSGGDESPDELTADRGDDGDFALYLAAVDHSLALDEPEEAGGDDGGGQFGEDQNDAG